MKKKENSLFYKLKQENNSNFESARVLNSIENNLKKLKKGTLLIDKVERIKTLQKNDSLESSNEIFEIINSKFEYTYPFYFQIPYSDYSPPNECEVKKDDVLLNHIQTEALMNSSKDDFDRVIELTEINKALNKRIYKPFKYGEKLAIWFGVAFVSFFVNLFSDRGSIYKFVSAFLFFPIPIIAFIIELVSYHIVKSDLQKRLSLNESIIKEKMSMLKTKANNV